jgi:hypothetical protein
MAIRLRLGDDPAGAVGEAKDWFRAQGRERFFWSVGPSTTPADAYERLLEQGAAPLRGLERAACMVLTEPPPEVTGVDIRKVETLAESEQVADVASDAFGWPDEHREAMRSSTRRYWDDRDAWLRETFGAYLDDRLVAFGVASYTPHGVFLDGGATRPEARGRGLYTALVRARWDEAVRRATPALVVQAGEMSRPILERLGFRTLCEVRQLEDRA